MMLARIRTGDTVKVISGKFKGKVGNVLRILNKKNRVIIEGVNIQTVNRKARQANEKGEQIKREGSIHITNVMPIDPATKKFVGTKDEATKVKGARVGTKVLEDGRKVRIAKSSGEVIEAKSE
ncbi:MAG: 50S ribosomal protein L24 [Myxococcota bacterium]